MFSAPEEDLARATVSPPTGFSAPAEDLERAKAPFVAPIEDQAEAIRTRMHEPGLTYDPTQGDAKVLMQADAEKPFGAKVADGLNAAGNAFVQLPLDLAHLVTSIGNKPTQSPNPGAASGLMSSPFNLADSPNLTEAASRGLRNDAYNFGFRPLNYLLFDAFRDTPEKYHARLLDKLNFERKSERLSQGKETLVAPKDQTDPALSDLGSYVLDPASLAPGVKVLGPLGKLGSKAAGKVIGKGAEIAEVGARGVKNLAKLPEQALAKVVPDKVVSGAVAGGVAAAGAMAGIPVLPAIGAIKGTQAAAAVTEKAAQAVKELAQTEGTSQFSRLAQLARNPDAPLWLRKTAASLDKTPIEGVLKAGTEIAEGGAKGAAIGAASSALSGDNAEEIGGAAGSGAALGTMAGAAMRPFTKAARVIEGKRADIERFVGRLKEQGAPDDLIARLGDDTVLAMATFDKIFEGKVGVEVVDGATFNSRSPNGKNQAGFYDRSNKQIVLNSDAKLARGPDETFYHEIQHALEDSAVADLPQLRTVIDAVVGDPARLEEAKYEYASRFVRGQLGLSPTATPKPEVVKAAIERFNGESLRNFNDPSHWIYSEIFADAGLRAMKGQDILGIAKSPLLKARKLDFVRSFLEKLGVKFESREVPTENGAKTTLFSPNFDDVLDSPALRRVVYKYVRDRNAYISGVTKAEPSATPVTPDMIGRHPGLPVHPLPDGTKGNDFAKVMPDGTVIPYTAKQVRTIEKTRAAEVDAAIPPGPVAPFGDPDPTVKRRRTIGGMTLITGTKLGSWFYNLASMGPEAKANARLIEGAIEKGNTLSLWYQAAGTGRGKEYTESLRKFRGGLSISQREGTPFAIHVSKTGEQDFNGNIVKTGGNVRVAFLDMTSANKKIARWQGEKKLEPLWAGDANAFKQDLFSYLKNVAAGQPGDAGIGLDKKNSLNAFLLGANKGFADANPLRTLLRGGDKDGIIRTFRIDRIEGIKPLPSDPITVDYPRMVRNLSPEGGLTPETDPNFSPEGSPIIRDQADEYAKGAKLPYKPYNAYAPVQEDYARRVADAYDTAQHNPTAQEVRTAYDAFGKETVAQWQYLTGKGVQMEPWAGQGEPYKSSRDMVKDVRENKHLWFFPTAAGFGEGENAAGHPLLAPSGVKAGGKDLLLNDIFRAVHDYFGHAKEGYEFGPRGEYNAFLSHASMYSDAARPALAAETLGQNSWVNYGKHLRTGPEGSIPGRGQEGYVEPGQRPFAAQKATVLPGDLLKELSFSPDASKQELPDDLARPFYSQLQRVIDKKVQGNSIPAAQLAAIVRNPQNGVKAEELKWSGLDDFLKGKGKVTKQEVVDFLKQNEVQIKEIEKGIEGNDRAAELDQQIDDLEREIQYGDFSNDREELTTLRDQLRSLRAKRDDANPSTKFEQYQLPGGENYRELLFTLPRKQRAGFGITGDAANGFQLRDRMNKVIGEYRTDAEAQEAYRKAEGLSMRDVAPPYNSSHWDEANVLGHVRFNERTGAEGKKVLFVEEIQSDWHQEGRKRGYKGNPNTEGWTAKLGEGDPASGPVWEVRNNTGRWVVGIPTESGRTTAEEAIRRAADSERGPDHIRVPDAPFKSNWHELLFKRMLRYAAENGFDKLAWTTGEQQADRYNLAKQVNKIRINKNEDGTFEVVPYPINQSGPAPGIDNVKLEKLSDIIGKDLAEKVSQQTEDSHDYSGVDLKVGGEGMKGFYDKILPDFARKYGKKWSAEVGQTKISDPEAFKTESYSDFRERTGLDESEARGRYMKERQGRDPGNISIHSITITPEMKQSVLGEGQPLFSPDAYRVASDNGTFKVLEKTTGRTVQQSFQSRAEARQWLKHYAAINSRENTSEKLNGVEIVDGDPRAYHQPLFSPDALNLSEPELNRVSKRITSLTEMNGGSTFNVKDRQSLSGKPVYAISLFPERSLILPGKPSPQQIQEFIQKNSDLLNSDKLSVGTWFDQSSGNTYVDVSVTTSEGDFAKFLGKYYNQKAIFNLKDFEEIPTGGTGTTIPNLPKEADRLSKARLDYEAQKPDISIRQ